MSRECAQATVQQTGDNCFSQITQVDEIACFSATHMVFKYHFFLWLEKKFDHHSRQAKELTEAVLLLLNGLTRFAWE